jgi:colanic acid/amylovoran biosynthesis glycosyltransferase
LRYVPKGITRAAVIQSDDEMFYRSISPYGPFTEAAVGVSEQARSVLASMPEFRHARALYLPYGINIPPAFVPRRSKSDSPLRILYFGRLDRPQKRVQLFPEILRHLIESGISFLWTVAGQGEEAAFLEQNMKANRPGQEVRLRGGIPYADVPKLLQENDVFLLASNKEGLPLSLLEAMADGMVPVVTDMPSGIREVVSEGNGIKVPMDNVAGFAEAMVRLQRNPDEMERLSRSARETVAREFSTQAMTDRWLAAFPASNQHADWPERWKIRAPLSMPRPMYFSPPMRILRRLALRLRLRART